MASSDNESSGGDIPARKPTKAVAAEKPSDEDVGMDEDEYEVEAVISHKFEKNGTLKLWVKWKGYDEKDNTWEPEDNLEDCPEELEAYYNQIGGKPAPHKTPAKPASDRKRKISASVSQTPPVSGGRGRPAKKAATESPALGGTRIKDEEQYDLPSGSWEDHVSGIETMQMEGDILYAFLRWKTGHRSRHPSRVCNLKCPQQMLRFYESHLQFNYPASSDDQTKPVSASSAQSTNPNLQPQALNGSKGAVTRLGEDRVEDDNEELGVKGVATTL